MTCRVLQHATVAALCCAAGLVCTLAAGQAPTPEATPAPFPSDDVLVRGRSPADLRVDIEAAEDAFYARFNAINSSDDFDIVCAQRLFTGSKVPRRVCQPKFERDAQERSGRDSLGGLQGSGFTDGSGQSSGRAHYMYQQLEAEIRKLSAEDPQLRDELARLGSLKQAYEAATNKQGKKK